MNDKYLWDIIDGLRDEVKELQAEVERYKFHAETRANELVKRGAKLKELQAENVELKAKLNELQDERNTLKYALENKECGCVIPMEYKQEARDYMNHNPKVNKVYFFMVADDCIGDDGYAQDWSCNVEDAVAVVNNE